MLKALIERVRQGQRTIRFPGQAPVLDTALGRGARLPFGCRMGSCGMCCARLLEGRVDQSTQIFLTEEQEKQGELADFRPRVHLTIVPATRFL